MDFITTNIYGEENGYLKHCGVEFIVGMDNNFEVKIQNQYFDNTKHRKNCRIFCPGTEYGGIIRAINPVTEDGIVKLTGPSWRGMLNQRAIHPWKNEYLYLNGEANSVLSGLISSLDLAEIFTVSGDDSGIYFHNYQVQLQTMLLDGFSEALGLHNARLDIKYKVGESNGRGYVLLKAAQVSDHSDEIEISEDGNVKLNILDYQNGINHLICLGKGELLDRQQVDLYAHPDGSISKTKYYTGIDIIEQYYENTSSESVEDLEEEGRKKFEDLKNYKQLKISVSDMDLELGDIIGGRERITGIYMKSPVVKKTLNVSGKSRVKISYKLKGEN